MMVKLKHKCPQKPLILPAALHLETLAQFQVIIFCNNVDLETMLLKIIFVIYIYIYCGIHDSTKNLLHPEPFHSLNRKEQLF